MMAWSIVTLLLCMIPGIVAITKVSKANAAYSADEARGYLRSAKKWNIAGCIIGVLAIIGMLSNGSLGGSTSTAPKATQAPSTYTSQPYTPSTPRPTTAPRPTAAPSQASGGDAYLEKARQYADDGDYHSAVRQILECIDKYPDSAAADEAAELMVGINSKLQPGEPQTGKVFDRTIKYQGGGELNVTAESGPLVVTVTCVSDRSQYVRFYVRKGETATIPLPSYTFEVTCMVGFVWFGDKIGFGDIYYDRNLDEYLDFSTSSDNAWTSNTVWTLTI